MMSSTQCDSINDIPDIILNAQTLSGHSDPVLTRVSHIGNLPIEIHQKIAFKLNSKDYASLRATCKSMSNNLDSLAVIGYKLKHKIVSGDTEKEYREIIYDSKIKRLFEAYQSKDVMFAVESCFACPLSLFEGYVMVGTTSLSDHYRRNYQKRIDDAVYSCCRGVENLVPSAAYRGCILCKNYGNTRKIIFYIDNNLINKTSMHTVFSSFNNVYHDSEGAEKLVVARWPVHLKITGVKLLPAM